MSQNHPMETRRRSRSNTPFLRSDCDHEHCEYAHEEGHHHHKKKAPADAPPNVQTIHEESVEVSSSSSSPVAKQTSQKIKTSDYSSDDTSADNTKITSRSTLETHKMESSATYLTTTTTTTSSSTTLLTKSKKGGSSNSLGATTSTPKTNYAVDSFVAQFASSPGGSLSAGSPLSVATQGRRGITETTQNKVIAGVERSQQKEQKQHYSASANKSKNDNSHRIQTKNNKSNNSSSNSNRSFSRFFNNSFGSSGGRNSGNATDLSDHIAYQEYKRAGEYWKNTPKTDYTYSELSPHRRELAPGVIAMPNMSRYSLENHHERIHNMVERDPARESYIRRRYELPKYSQNRRDTAKLVYDSGDEVDLTQYDDSNRKSQYSMAKQSQESWFVRTLTTVVTTFTSTWQTLFARVGDDRSMYRKKLRNHERGFFGNIGHGISSAFFGLYRYIYLCIAYVLSVDTWLLQSSNAENKGRKRFLLFLLILLPLLLLTGWHFLGENERSEYLQRTQSLVPVTLFASVRQALSSSSATIRNLFQQTTLEKTTLSSKPEFSPQEAKLHDIQQKIQKTLTPEEYRGILQHINKYMQQLFDLKLNRRKIIQAASDAHISPEMALSIANVVRVQLENIQWNDKGRDLSTLTDEEVQLIAQQVQLKLKGDDDLASIQKFALTPGHLEQIRQLIEHHLEVNNQHFYSSTLERINVDALLKRILAAPQLTQLIDSRITAAIDGKMLQLQEWAAGGAGSGVGAGVQQLDERQVLINELSSQIAFIKLALSDKHLEMENLQQAIENVKLGQNDLLYRLQAHELATDKRFSGLLAEIESKLASLKDQQFTLLNKQIKLSLVEILGFKQTAGEDGPPLTDVDLQNWVRSTFVAKEFLEQRLLEMNAHTNDMIRQEIDRSGMLLMRDISERLKQDILLAVESKQNESSAVIKGQINAATISEEDVKQLVKDVLAVYDADKTGLVDFALESAGGQILSTRCTESYQTKTAQISVFGIPLWYPTNTPRVAISPNVQPGECWAFQGFPGFLVLKLNSLVYVTGFTLEHIPKSLSPNGRIESAPRNFTVWGLEHEKDQDPVLFGEYEYVDSDASLQYFPLRNMHIKRPYEIVELRIESNHGHPTYTCLYRFRVHGKPSAA